MAKGTITTAQEQAILDAWIAKRATLKADRAQLRAILADGVITQAELDQLPSDSPLRALEPLLKNGQISVADLRALGRGILRDLRMGGALPPALQGGQPVREPGGRRLIRDHRHAGRDAAGTGAGGIGPSPRQLHFGCAAGRGLDGSGAAPPSSAA